MALLQRLGAAKRLAAGGQRLAAARRSDAVNAAPAQGRAAAARPRWRGASSIWTDGRRECASGARGRRLCTAAAARVGWWACGQRGRLAEAS